VGGSTPSEVTANQSELDTILDSIDRLSRTEFNGQRLLDGSRSYRLSGVDTSTIFDVDVIAKNATSDVDVNIDVTTAATQANDDYRDGTLSQDTTLTVTSPSGTATISLSSGSNTFDIQDAFNAVSAQTGITASRRNGNRVNFETLAYGSSATVEIQATQGTFDTSSGGNAAGTDAIATINGAQVTGSGSTFSHLSSDISLVIDVDPTAVGPLPTFVVSGSPVEVVLGASINDKASVGLPDVGLSSLGGVAGDLNSLRNGGVNALDGTNPGTALSIIDDSISEVTLAQTRIGAFQKYTLGSSERVLTSTIENLSESLSQIEDADVALETALLTNNQLLQQSTFQALSIASLENANVLGLLQAAGRF
jgi:flagellin-like hook-associated protein FlgL